MNLLTRNKSINVATILFGITIFLWIIVLTSVIGWTKFLNGKIVPAILVGVAILLPLVAVILSSTSRSNDDQAHVG